MNNQPPLGLAPRWVIAEHRVMDICEAIMEYTRAGLIVPREWTDELNDLTRYLRIRRKPTERVVDNGKA